MILFESSRSCLSLPAAGTILNRPCINSYMSLLEEQDKKRLLKFSSSFCISAFEYLTVVTARPVTGRLRADVKM